MTPADEDGVIALALCPLCAWQVEISGDTIAEVEAFLVRVASDHYREAHDGDAVGDVTLIRDIRDTRAWPS